MEKRSRRPSRLSTPAASPTSSASSCAPWPVMPLQKSARAPGLADDLGQLGRVLRRGGRSACLAVSGREPDGHADR